MIYEIISIKNILYQFLSYIHRCNNHKIKAIKKKKNTQNPSFFPHCKFTQTPSNKFSIYRFNTTAPWGDHSGGEKRLECPRSPRSLCPGSVTDFLTLLLTWTRQQHKRAALLAHPGASPLPTRRGEQSLGNPLAALLSPRLALLELTCHLLIRQVPFTSHSRQQLNCYFTSQMTPQPPRSKRFARPPCFILSSLTQSSSHSSVNQGHSSEPHF